MLGLYTLNIPRHFLNFTLNIKSHEYGEKLYICHKMILKEYKNVRIRMLECMRSGVRQMIHLVISTKRRPCVLLLSGYNKSFSYKIVSISYF